MYRPNRKLFSTVEVNVCEFIFGTNFIHREYVVGFIESCMLQYFGLDKASFCRGLNIIQVNKVRPQMRNALFQPEQTEGHEIGMNTLVIICFKAVSSD